MKIPVIYEVDPKTEEAIGLVHLFCCWSCLAASKEDAFADIRFRGFIPLIDEDYTCNYSSSSVCEECRGSLEECCP